MSDPIAILWIVRLVFQLLSSISDGIDKAKSDDGKISKDEMRKIIMDAFQSLFNSTSLENLIGK